MADQHSAATRPGAVSRWLRLVDPRRWPGAALIYSLVAGVACFWRLGATGLISMEGMVIDGARQMLASGDWVVPRVYGELYTYKPALAYWLASIPLRFADAPSEAMLRLPFAACGFVMGLVVLILIGRGVGWRAGLLSAVCSTTALLFLQKARIAEFDGALAAGVGIAVAAACFNLSADRQRWAIWLLGYLGLAAGFLTKGVPALMAFGPGVLAAAWAAGRLRRLFGWRHLSAVLLFVLIGGGYLWAAWQAAGPKAFEQPLVEARARGFGELSEEDLAAFPESRRFRGSEDGSEQGWARAIALLAAKPLLICGAFLPWSALLVSAFRRRVESPLDVGDRIHRSAVGFLLAGGLMFVLTPTLETRYFLPLAVPLGILCGLAADRWIGFEHERRRGTLIAAASVAALTVVATVFAAIKLDTPPIPLANRVALGVAGLGAAIGCLYLIKRRGRYRLLLLLATAALCTMLVQYLGSDPHRARRRDLSPQARILAPHLPAGESLWVLGPSDEAGKHASLYFYLDRPTFAFRPQGGLPAGGAHCLLTARGLAEIEKTPGFEFEEIARAEHDWFDYRLGVCSQGG